MQVRRWLMRTFILSVAVVSLLLRTTVTVSAAPSGYRIPFFGKAVITNGPGQGLHTGSSSEAIDYSPRGWSNIQATQSGTVIFSVDLGPNGFGQVIVIKHTSGGTTYSYYAHLSSRNVVSGTAVSRGQTIGVVGNTGCGSCGIHLHFESHSGVSEPVTANNIYTSGSGVWIRDIRGTGWFPWWPNASRDSGWVAYSTSHPIGQCTGNPILNMIWPPSNEVSRGGSTISGYSWVFSTSSTTIPDTVVDGGAAVGSTSKNLSGSQGVNWWFHMKVKDTSNNWTTDANTVHLGPFCYQ